METDSNSQQAITHDELSNKVLMGTQLAIQRLIERKRKEDGYLVVSENGKVVMLRARDIPLKEETDKSNPL